MNAFSSIIKFAWTESDPFSNNINALKGRCYSFRKHLNVSPTSESHFGLMTPFFRHKVNFSLLNRKLNVFVLKLDLKIWIFLKKYLSFKRRQAGTWMLNGTHHKWIAGSRVLSGKLAVAQLVKGISAFYGNRYFIILYKGSATCVTCTCQHLLKSTGVVTICGSSLRFNKKVKIKLSVCVPWRIRWNVGIAPRILNLDVIWECLIGFTHRLLKHRGEIPVSIE